MVVLLAVNAQYLKSDYEQATYGRVDNGIEVWLIFVPSMVFGLLIDIEVLVQCALHKPIAFKTTPRFSRSLLLAIGILSLVVSGVLILFSFLAFSPMKSQAEFTKWFFYTLYVKAICLSPFIALEFFDLMFENIYLDV